MGLLKRHDSGKGGRPERVDHWYVALVLILICATIAAFGDGGREVLKYDRLAISHGEYWRLFTGHLAHLGLSHLTLNLAGLVLTWLLVGRNYSISRWLVVFLISVLIISAGFWFVDKNLLWYVGLSGVLHGLLLAGAIEGLTSLPAESVVICVLVIGKLTYEQLVGPLPGSESTSGGDVVVNAHFFGAIGGLISAGFFWRRVGTGSPI